MGLLLIWVAFGMLGAASKCNLPGGWPMAFCACSCTFGFIAPLLAIITVQEKIVTDLLLITLFAPGHCLPIAVAGSSTALIIIIGVRVIGIRVKLKVKSGQLISL